MKEKIMGLMLDSQDSRECIRSINLQVCLIEEHSKDGLMSDVLDHMKLISLDTERLSKELEQREKALREIFYEYLDDVDFSGNQEKVSKIIEGHLQHMIEVKQAYNKTVEDTGIYQRLSDRIGND